MTTNKPEVVAYVDLHRGHGRRYVSLRRGVDHYTLNDGDQLIHLSDYEALQADRDQQYDMKVKAREQRDAVTAKLKALQAECAQLRKDAERYQTLRSLHWFSSRLAVVRNPYEAIKPGHDCPSGDRLDSAVDEIIGEHP